MKAQPFGVKSAPKNPKNLRVNSQSRKVHQSSRHSCGVVHGGTLSGRHHFRRSSKTSAASSNLAPASNGKTIVAEQIPNFWRIFPKKVWISQARQVTYRANLGVTYIFAANRRRIPQILILKSLASYSHPETLNPQTPKAPNPKTPNTLNPEKLNPESLESKPLP